MIRSEREELKSDEMLEMERLKVKREELTRVPGEGTKLERLNCHSLRSTKTTLTHAYPDLRM